LFFIDDLRKTAGDGPVTFEFLSGFGLGTSSADAVQAIAPSIMIASRTLISFFILLLPP
jgi:hypothetical protein